MEKNTSPIVIKGNACFVSDMHFMVPVDDESRFREELLVQFLNQQADQIQHLFLLGDVFDFWFEYQDVAPKGYFKLYQKLYELRCKGVQLYYFTGNHDMWLQDFFPGQIGCIIFNEPACFIINGKRCIIGHGDGLGGKQLGYRFIKSIFALKTNQFVYSMLHPRFAFAIARFFSAKSRKSNLKKPSLFRGEEEPQVRYARQQLVQEDYDFFIFAHLHLPQQYQLTDKATYFNCGDWFTHFSYLSMNQDQPAPQIHYFSEKNSNE